MTRDGVLLAISYWAIGCGNSTLAPVADASSPDDSAEPSFALDAGIEPCPAQVPKVGSRCAAAQQVCEYGTNPRITCETLAFCAPPLCTNDPPVWSVSTPDPTACALDEGAKCPNQFDAALDNAKCTQDWCAWANGWCECKSLSKWSCTPAPADCPSVRPRFGDPCDGGASLCPTPSSDDPSGCAARWFTCSSGQWQPVSTCRPTVLPC